MSEKQFDRIVDEIFRLYQNNDKKSTQINFDLSDLEWISNQELLFFTSLLKTFVDVNFSFQVFFLKNGSTAQLNYRKARQLVQIWDVWKIGKVIPNQQYNDYFDIDSNIVQRLKIKFKIGDTYNQIYDRFGITPFIFLDYFKSYDDKLIGEMMKKVYRLNAAVNEIIKKQNCELPFKNETLSLIITKELYENFLDHSSFQQIEANPAYCFMSISLKAKLDERNLTQEKVQKLLQFNLNEEYPKEVIPFFYDETTRKYKNQSILQLSFLDFGSGIPNTLRSEFLKKNKDHSYDADILSFAFNFDSSKDPVERKYLRKTNFPRGLFDLISIVKRFNGLLIARSNFGKILFDFSRKNSFENALRYFGNSKEYFPGTLISVYIPERKSENNIDTSSIKPLINKVNLKYDTKSIAYLSLFQIQLQIKKETPEKSDLYNHLFKVIYEQFSVIDNAALIYFDFEGYDIDDRVTRKIIYFLISDYKINQLKNVIVLNPPTKEYLDEIKNEIFSLSEVIKNFYVHPTPFIYYNSQTQTINLYWLGVFEETDIRKLNDLLLDSHDLRRSDFLFPEMISGNVNYYDQYGNLKSLIQRDFIIKIIEERSKLIQETEVKNAILSITKNDGDNYYLCKGNYYQKEYIQIVDILNEQSVCSFLSRKLYHQIELSLFDLHTYKFISVSTGSHKIVNSLLKAKLITEENLITLDGYEEIKNEKNFIKIQSHSKLILICDIISTGYVFKELSNYLNAFDLFLEKICVIVNAIDYSFEPIEMQYSSFKGKVIALYSHPIEKFRREFIHQEIIDKNLIVHRINPYTNTVIDQLTYIGFAETIKLNNKQFLDFLDDSDIKIGYFRFNNLIHPYFFDMDKILANENKSQRLLKAIFERIDPELLTDICVIFYPKNSGIKNISKDFFRDKIFNDQNIKVFELERFSTNEGWRFLHPTQFVSDYTKNKKVLILDDGSCSGESIIQMVDEIITLDVTEILLVSIIARINDRKLDFFSRLKYLKDQDRDIRLSVLFGCHWHVPTYFVEESPITKERKWLDEVESLSNLPYRLKGIIENVKKEISIKEVWEDNNEFILKDYTGKIPIKDILLVKEEVGKVSNFNFYKNKFDFFDRMVKSYYSNTLKYERFRSVELMCAVILHEPYLFDKVKNVIPDITGIIEEFVLSMLDINTTHNHSKGLRVKNLNYKWTKKSILHIFFIVFDDEKLLKILRVSTLSALITNFCNSDHDLAYMLYRLLLKVAISNDEIASKKFGGQIKHLIEIVSENDEVKNKALLKTFDSFISTLPYKETDFLQNLSKIRDNYSKITSDKYHNEYVYNDKQRLSTQVTLMIKNVAEGKDYRNEVNVIKNAWQSISAFIEELLQFITTFPSYILPLSDQATSLHKIEKLKTYHAEICKIISEEIVLDFEQVRTKTDWIFNNFILKESRFPEMFLIPHVNIKDQYRDFIIELMKDYPDIILRGELPKKAIVDFPLVYFKEIVLKEIKNNFRYADFTKEVSFEWFISNDSIKLEIKNFIAKDISDSSGGKGLDKLSKLNDFPIKPTNYFTTKQKTTFIQTLIFKRI